MAEANQHPSAERASRRADFWTVGVLGILLALLYLPLVQWLGKQTFRAEQLHNSGLIVVVTLLIGVRGAIRRRSLAPQMGRLGFGLILSGLGVLVLLKLLPSLTLLLALLSFCLSFAGLTALLLGSDAVRQLLPAIVGLLLLGLFVAVAPTADWPLRALAAKSTAKILGALGVDVQVALHIAQPPQLLLGVDGRVFVVAAECNGFGLLCSCFLVASVLVFHYPLAWMGRIVLIGIAAPVAISFNTLRIVAITLAAGVLPLPYMLIHEGLGVLSYLGALGFLWWLARRLATRRPVGACDQAEPLNARRSFFDGWRRGRQKCRDSTKS